MDFICEPTIQYLNDIIWYAYNIVWYKVYFHYKLLCISVYINMYPMQTCIHTSVQFSHSVASNSSRPYGAQHARPPCSSPTPGVYSNSCPLSQWCHPTISSFVNPFSSCLQSFPASESFQMSQLFAFILFIFWIALWNILTAHISTDDPWDSTSPLISIPPNGRPYIFKNVFLITPLII